MGLPYYGISDFSFEKSISNLTIVEANLYSSIIPIEVSHILTEVLYGTQRTSGDDYSMEYFVDNVGKILGILHYMANELLSKQAI